MKKLIIIAVCTLFTLVSLTAGESNFLLSGYVISSNGSPVSKATVTCQQTSSSMITDIDGYYQVSCKSNVSNTIIVSHSQYGRQVFNSPSSDSDIEDFDLSLR